MVKREQLVNNASSTLNGAITDVATTLDVTSATSFPADGFFRIIINNEIMRVTAVSTNTFTVERGVEGTTAAAHSDTDAVTAIVTAASIKNIIREPIPFRTDTPHKIWVNGAVKTVSDFTWVNQGTAAATDDGTGISLEAPDNAAAIGFRGLFITAPTPPYVIKAFCLHGPGMEEGSDGSSIGIGFRDNTSGELMIIDFRVGTNVRVAKMDSPTTLNTSAATIDNAHERLWLRIEDNNTNLIFSASSDDDTYVELFSEARTTFLTPDEVGLVINAYNVGADVATTCFAHFTAFVEE